MKKFAHFLHRKGQLRGKNGGILDQFVVLIQTGSPRAGPLSYYRFCFFSCKKTYKAILLSINKENSKPTASGWATRLSLESEIESIVNVESQDFRPTLLPQAGFGNIVFGII